MYHSYLQQCKSEYTVIINYTTQTHNSVEKLSETILRNTYNYKENS